MTKLNCAVAIFLGLSLLMLAYGIDIILRHGADPAWPGHARYHVTLSGLHMVTFSTMLVVAAVGGLRKRRRSAWIMLAIASTLGCASWPLARLLAGDPPPVSVQLHLGIALVAGLVGLALSGKYCFGYDSPA